MFSGVESITGTGDGDGDGLGVGVMMGVGDGVGVALCFAEPVHAQHPETMSTLIMINVKSIVFFMVSP
jgi:hypothetical protein